MYEERERRRPCMRRERGRDHAHLLGSLVLFCPTGSSRLQLLWGRLHPPLSPAHVHNHTLQLVLTPPTYSSLLTTHTHSSSPTHTYSSLLTTHTHTPHSSPTHILLTPHHPHTLFTPHHPHTLLTPHHPHTHSSLLTHLCLQIPGNVCGDLSLSCGRNQDVTLCCQQVLLSRCGSREAHNGAVGLSGV